MSKSFFERTSEKIDGSKVEREHVKAEGIPAIICSCFHKGVLGTLGSVIKGIISFLEIIQQLFKHNYFICSLKNQYYLELAL